MALTQIDRDLLQRCLTGSPEGWRDFVNRFLGLFIHVVNHAAESRGLRLSPQDVEDLCAEIFVALLDRDFAVLRQFRLQSSLATYLCVIARRIAVRQLLRQRPADGNGQVIITDLQQHDPPAPSTDQQRIDDQEYIGQMLEGLSEPEATIIRQFHLEGRSYRDISQDLGIPENSIGPTLARARARLRSRQVRL